MDILIGKRQEGKTTHLIKMSAAGQGTIVAPTEQSARYIKRQAKEMKLDIPEPITWNRLTQIGGGGYGGGPYLLDELGGILRGLGIETAILDDECNIKYLTGEPLHYGEDLTAKIRETTKDFSKLSDFDKFVLDNGYRYKTREELQAGYDRHWKAAHNILVTMEEFLAEAGKKPGATAADTYKALVSLVELKKLRPREVFGYAHYRWCLNKPEAIVAYQTGRDEWSVNNCDTEITEDEAIVKISEEWGFKPSRIQIIGVPYYDATDWQFICFNCARMTWLWQNGSLLQVAATLFRRKKPPASESIQKFVDILYQFERENPDELCPPETNPQLVVDCLCDTFLGTNWYIAMPVNTKQANTIILDRILRMHSREFRNLVKEKREEWKRS